ncbi:MAG: indolepyruvate oxidoreductase subunit beta family protein [Stappiaceae bacterium]
MARAANKSAPPLREKPSDVIKIAVLAVGGQGGGVLTNWISDLGTLGGYAVQMTSVAGVAQRTGATIYYVEMAPKADQTPVFALSPSPGDLDVLIAAELMEAGRAVLRGFITPDRTTLVASTHRILSVSEKQVPGDGRSNTELVEEEIVKASLSSVCFDMETIASNAGSMISASLFGGLARSGALPFDTSLYEEVISASGRGVEQSLAAFRGALTFDQDLPPPAHEVKTNRETGPPDLLEKWKGLLKTLENVETESRDMALEGLRKVVDFQDTDYGSQYLQHVLELQALDSAEQHFRLTTTGAKYIANAMCYDDILRVADLKTRASRNSRLLQEQEASGDQVVHVTEYFHPRGKDVCGSLPVGIGRWIERTPWAFRTLDGMTNKGRRIRTDGIIGFGLLWFVSSFKPHRKRLLRHTHERAHLDRLLQTTHRTVPIDYELAIEVLSAQRLVKGYSDTHERGHSKFSKVLAALPLLQGREDAAQWMRRLREISLKDEKGEALDGALATVGSFTEQSAARDADH